MVAKGACRPCVRSRAQGTGLRCLEGRNLEGGEAKRQAGARRFSSAWFADATRRPWCVPHAAAYSGAHAYNIWTWLQHLHNISTGSLTHVCFGTLGGPVRARGEGGTGRAPLALAAHDTRLKDKQKQL